MGLSLQGVGYERLRSLKTDFKLLRCLRSKPSLSVPSGASGI